MDSGEELIVGHEWDFNRGRMSDEEWGGHARAVIKEMEDEGLIEIDEVADNRSMMTITLRPGEALMALGEETGLPPDLLGSQHFAHRFNRRLAAFGSSAALSKPSQRVMGAKELEEHMHPPEDEHQWR